MTGPLFETPNFPKSIIRRRLKQIMTFLHFNSETALPADRISKVKLVLDYFVQKSREDDSDSKFIILENLKKNRMNSDQNG